MGPKGPVPHVRFSQNNDGSGALLGQFGGQFKLEKPAGKVELVFPDKSPQLKIPGNARAFGEWNDLVITARDGRLTIESNGEHQVTAAECNPRKGHIGMEAIGAEFHYRNVEIKELPPAPPEPEFQPLFNGKNLNGWELPSADADKWSVESGEIVRKPGAIPNVLMTRRRDYGNFHLRAEAKVSDKGTGGVQLRVNEFSGYQADINGSILKLLAKGGPAVLAKSAAPLVPPDTWFTLDVIAEGPIVTVQVNGVKSAEIRSADSRIGPIGLAAGANTELRFRKVEIKELTPAIASWKSLFNGKDLDGWNIPNKMDGLWTVDFGVLKGTAKKDKAYQLYSQSEFKDFHLRAKTQVKPGRAGTVYVRIRDGAWKGVGVKLHHLTARDLEVSLFSALNPVRTLATKRCTLGADQWFDLEIIAVGPRLEVRVDGAPAGEYTFTPEDAAKHHSEGGIVFEVADPYSELSFSKIEIQELPSVNR
jgi:hypothetical protein